MWRDCVAVGFLTRWSLLKMEGVGREKSTLIRPKEGGQLWTLDTRLVLEMPHTVCCVRTRQDSRGCDLPQDTPSGRGRRRVYTDPVWTPQAKGQQRRGWRRTPLTVRGREVRLLW